MTLSQTMFYIKKSVENVPWDIKKCWILTEALWNFTAFIELTCISLRFSFSRLCLSIHSRAFNLSVDIAAWKMQNILSVSIKFQWEINFRPYTRLLQSSSSVNRAENRLIFWNIPKLEKLAIFIEKLKKGTVGARASLYTSSFFGRKTQNHFNFASLQGSF